MEPDVSIIIANRNGRSFLQDCLDSLQGEGRPCRCSYEIIVTDNASTDGSVEMVKSDYPEVRGVYNQQDLGYCGSNNKAVREANGRYVLLLNNDTQVKAEAVDLLVEFMDETPVAGGVGARLFYPDGSEQYSGRLFPEPANALFGRLSLLSRLLPSNRWYREYICADALEAGEPFEVDWISHAGGLYRRQAFLDAGALDEDLYYWNEPVLSLGLHEHGWKMFLHPQSRIVHYEGFGSGRRPPSVWRRHHLDFAKGSFRFYCLYKKYRSLDPRRILVWAGLYGRACALAIREYLWFQRS